jgi:hypothetical protein
MSHSHLSLHVDGFLSFVTWHTAPDGGLAEQFDRASRAPVCVVDLTWSYAAALTVFCVMKGGGVNVNDAFICSKVGCVEVIPHLINNRAPYGVYVNCAWLPGGDMLAESYTLEHNRIVAHFEGIHFQKVPLTTTRDCFKFRVEHGNRCGCASASRGHAERISGQSEAITERNREQDAHAPWLHLALSGLGFTPSPQWSKFPSLFCLSSTNPSPPK